jgi:hypothetical protein
MERWGVVGKNLMMKYARQKSFPSSFKEYELSL